MKTSSTSINSRKTRSAPNSEGGGKVSDVDSHAPERKHNIDGALAASTGLAGQAEGDAHKDALK